MAVIASFIMHLHDSGEVTCSGLSSSPEKTATAQAVEAVQTVFPAAEPVVDPWANDAPWPTAPATVTPPTQTTATVAATPAPTAPACAHGPRHYVPAGVSKSGPRAGQPYPAFWGCQADRSDPSRCKSLPA